MRAQEIGDSQLGFIQKAKRYIRNKEAQGVNTAESALCYLNSWSGVPGYAVLKWWQKGLSALSTVLSINLKSFIAIARLSGYQTFGGENSRPNRKKVIVSWCRAEDFSAEGVYNDRYFKTSSTASPGVLWFLISIDHFIPGEIPVNVRILAKEKGRPSHDLLFLLRTFFSTIRNCSFSPRRIKHQLSVSCIQAKMASDHLAAVLSEQECTGVLLPYEAQPLHQAIFQRVKIIDPRIITAGYLHSALPPLMTDLVYRPGAPDLLYVHGEGQISILQRLLGWPEASLRFIPSLRFRKEAGQQSMSGFIYLPYTFFDEAIYVREFENFLETAKPASLYKLVTRNHPHQAHSAKHLDLIAKLDILLQKYADRFTDTADRPMSVFFGATAAIIEALEREVQVIHICTDPVFESHAQVIWDNMEVTQISDLTFSYTIQEKGKYITLGEGDQLFTEILTF